jgi:hypothetical protein
MTRRLLATVCLAASMGAGAVPALAQHDRLLCIGGDNQRIPGNQQGICLGGRTIISTP